MKMKRKVAEGVHKVKEAARVGKRKVAQATAGSDHFSHTPEDLVCDTDREREREREGQTHTNNDGPHKQIRAHTTCKHLHTPAHQIFFSLRSIPLSFPVCPPQLKQDDVRRRAEDVQYQQTELEAKDPSF